MNGGTADPVGPRQLPETMSAAAVAKDGFAGQFERPAADVAAVKPGAPHPGANSFDDQTALQLGDGADDHHDGPAQGSTGIDVLAETRVFDAQTVELIQNFQEVLHRAGDPVRGPDQDHIEAAA